MSEQTDNRDGSKELFSEVIDNCDSTLECIEYEEHTLDKDENQNESLSLQDNSSTVELKVTNQQTSTNPCSVMNILKETVSIDDGMSTVDLQINKEKGVTLNSENNVSKETVVLDESVEMKIKVQVHVEDKSSFKVPEIHKETAAECDKHEAMEA